MYQSPLNKIYDSFWVIRYILGPSGGIEAGVVLLLYLNESLFSLYILRTVNHASPSDNGECKKKSFFAPSSECRDSVNPAQFLPFGAPSDDFELCFR